MNVEKFHDIGKSKVLIYGDFMVDKYIWGNVKRISPEAPVPILEVKKKQSKLGGAGNVVNNVVSLGATTRVLGCVGNDEDGEWIMQHLEKIGVNIDFLEKRDEVQTIVKTRIVSKNQQYIRLDEEIVRDIPKEYAQKVKNNIDMILSDITVIIISDYGKGSVTKDLTQFIIECANRNKIPIVVDPKGTDYTKYCGATVCTPNVNELSIVSGRTLENENDILESGTILRKETNFKYLMLTRSEKGISVFFEDGNKKDFPALEKDVVDVTGAGDTVVAVAALCLGVGYTIEECCIFANMAASIVCSRFGAATLSMNELIECVLYSGEFKYVDVNVAKFITENLRAKGKKIVFTNGCFDLVHAGHASSFHQAKSMGDILIVAVNSDASVKRLKGDKRPIVQQQQRIALLCALESVDYVILMEDDNPVNLIQILQPDIAVKGKDWEGKNIPEQAVVEAYGGKMEFIDLEQGLSTSSLIKKITEMDLNE